MILELVAGRLIARYVGSSLYTWTSVIGVVLSGITIGNYLGGRVADRFNAQKSLSVIFGISSAACAIIVIMNNLVPNIVWLWQFGFPFRIFSHVTLVFLVPSILLGMISPIVAKMALDRGLPVGRTVGDVYAWSAAGSIVGTFLAGFYLIGAMGTIAIIWTVSACLLLMAILYWKRLWFLYIWAIVFLMLVTLGTSTVSWAANIGSFLELREPPNPDIIYENESHYCYIAVKQLSKDPDKRLFIEDVDNHSGILMDNIEDLQFGYFKIYAALTHRISLQKKQLSTLTIGGGGCVFPRYIEKVWPGSRVDVVEIDPAVTEAAVQAFGLSRETPINIYAMDARNYIDSLLERNNSGAQIPKYDFIYEDAFSSTAIPFQLVTEEFNDKIARILNDDGVYIMNLIDIYDSGLFLGAVINTLEKTFGNVYVLSAKIPHNLESNFIIAASNNKICLDDLDKDKVLTDINLWVLSKPEIDSLKVKANEIVLTDDYAPVDELLAPAAFEKARVLLANRCWLQAIALENKNEYDACISKFRKAMDIYPELTVTAYEQIGLALAKQGKWEEAIDAGQRALQYNEKAEVKQSVAMLHYNIGTTLKKIGRNNEAWAQLGKAVEGFRADLVKDPNSVKTITELGNAYAEKGDFARAAGCFQQAVDKDPSDINNQMLLAQSLMARGLYDQAVEKLRKCEELMTNNGRADDALKARDYIKRIENNRASIR
jgi:spermidine synthase